jgi:hypothetical protein
VKQDNYAAFVECMLQKNLDPNFFPPETGGYPSICILLCRTQEHGRELRPLLFHQGMLSLVNCWTFKSVIQVSSLFIILWPIEALRIKIIIIIIIIED